MFGAMLLILLAACGQLALFNVPPETAIHSPSSGALVSLSQPVTFVAEISDDYDRLDELLIRWTLADGTPLTGTTVLDAENDTVTFTTQGQLPKGEPTITLRVADSMGETGRSTITLLVFDDLPPTIAWLSPVEGGRYPGGWSVAVSLEISDPDPVDETPIALVWSQTAIDLAGALPGEVPQSGSISLELEAVALSHWTLGVTATDSLGASATSTVGFDVVNGDYDNDSYIDEALGGDDCDDTNGGVHPGVPESCNSRDDDCDGLLDEEASDALPWYADGDEDGYGDVNDVFKNCTSVAGRVADSWDCDDGNAAINPGMPEVCNDFDDNCDDVIDDDAVDKLDAYTDWDEDGYGAGPVHSVCDLADDDVFNDDDCDDGDDAVHPGAIEVCDAFNEDDDCNSLAEDADPAATGKSTYYADLDGDGRGDSATSADYCDAPSGWAANTDDCDDTESLAWSGNTETCEDGADNDCTDGDATCRLAGDIVVTAADVALEGPAYSFSGTVIAPMGDVDGDSLGDVAVAAWGTGEVYLVPASGLTSGLLSRYGVLTDTTSGSGFGWSARGVGDVDGSGTPDLLVGAVFDGGDAGAVYLFEGGIAGGSTAMATVAHTGNSGDGLGVAVGGGEDFDGDGDLDVLIGGNGAAYLVDGPSFSNLASWAGEAKGAGSALGMGDVNGDGLADVVVGDHESSAAYLVLGTGAPADLDLADADALFLGESVDDQAGYSLDASADIDADGYHDVLLGAPGNGAASMQAGAAYLVRGAAAPVDLSLNAADSTWRGETKADRAGYTVASAGDVDADGFDDLLVGAYGSDVHAYNGGTAYLIYGTSVPIGIASLSSRDAQLSGASTNGSAGEGLAGVGDVSGDGIEDVAIGAPSESASSGMAYFFWGGAL
ncbi:hypothetical protein LBMAG42_09760 [Deltaproteobacteria bacterium]|nr:hypothetical protein LBMAG42_09760 [Deltaproteobacteria bacterium]